MVKAYPSVVAMQCALRGSFSVDQGLTLVLYLAQLKRFLWNMGAFRGCLGGIQEVFRRCRGLSGGV